MSFRHAWLMAGLLMASPAAYTIGPGGGFPTGSNPSLPPQGGHPAGSKPPPPDPTILDTAATLLKSSSAKKLASPEDQRSILKPKPPAGPPRITVKLLEDTVHMDVQHGSQMVRIQRIQDSANKLLDDYARTSRPCPPACIQPIGAAPGVLTLGEVEVLDSMAKRLAGSNEILIDLRPVEANRLETLPTAVSIPAEVLVDASPNRHKVLELLGAVASPDGRWDFQNAKSLVLWCDGPWSDLAPRTIRALIRQGYPAEKLKYYRGGMQDWKKLGLTTVVQSIKP